MSRRIAAVLLAAGALLATSAPAQAAWGFGDNDTVCYASTSTGADHIQIAYQPLYWHNIYKGQCAYNVVGIHLLAPATSQWGYPYPEGVYWIQQDNVRLVLKGR